VRLILQIDELAPGGEGLGHADGRSVFVPFTAPGDRVAVEVAAGDGAEGGAIHAELLEVLTEGPARQAVPCPHFGPAGHRCGGCEWLHAVPLVQLAAKARAVRQALRRIGRLEPDAYRWLPPLASPEALEYRSRARFHLDRGEGRLVFFQRRSHRPVPLERCHLLAPGLERLRAALGPALLQAGLAPRQVALEWSEHQGGGAALLVLASASERERRRAEALLAAVPELSGLVLQAEGAPAVLLGDPVLRHERVPGRPAAGLCRSRPDVFQQANRRANAMLVEAAVALVAPEGEEVLELYCGAGNFTGPLAERARHVSAIEQQGPALDLARADLAGGRVRFFAGDALAVARAFARERGDGARRFGAALLDPPRQGAKGIGPALRDLGVPRAVYVSCDPATLARDVKGCVEAGYRVDAVQVVDLFPQTHHVEAVVLLVGPSDLRPKATAPPGAAIG
jgi:23S rRNA (uracil1939-C5)-methyltransferase